MKNTEICIQGTIQNSSRINTRFTTGSIIFRMLKEKDKNKIFQAAKKPTKIQKTITYKGNTIKFLGNLYK